MPEKATYQDRGSIEKSNDGSDAGRDVPHTRGYTIEKYSHKTHECGIKLRDVKFHQQVKELHSCSARKNEVTEKTYKASTTGKLSTHDKEGSRN